MRVTVSALALCCALAALPASTLAQHVHHGAADTSAHVITAMTVRADRERIMLRSGRTLVDARALAAATGSIADLLRAVPGVEIDAHGNVSMRGNTHALVMINGRRTALTGEALVAYLRQTPAQSLERVEVATAPSAKEDANGSGGMLNLVFRDADDAEHTTPLRSVSGTFASQHDYNATAAATGHAGRLVHWNAAYSTSANRPQTRADVSRWTVLPGDLPFTTEEDVRSTATHQLQSVIAGAAVTPTPATSFGLRGTYSAMTGATSTRRNAAYRDEAGNTAASSMASVVEHVMPTSELIGTARVERGRVRFASELRGSSVRGEYRGDYDDVGVGFRYLSATMNSRQREHVLRNDLRVRLSGVDVELGHESRSRRATAEHDAVHLSVAESRTFRHESAVHAGYVSAARSAGVFRGEAAVRLEHERDQVSLDSTRVRRTLRAFPSLSGEWVDATRGLVYRAAYGRRLTRPSWEMLNPLAMGDDGFGESVGNDRLRAEVVDQVEMGVERRTDRTTVQVTPFLRWSQDPIREISVATAQGMSRSPENMEWARSAGADVGMRAHATERIQVTIAGTVAHVETSRSEQQREGVHTSLRAALDVRITAQSTAQLLVAGRSRRNVEQGETLPEATAQLAIQRAVAGGRGAVTLRLNSPRRVNRHALRDAGRFSHQLRQDFVQPQVTLVASFGVGGTSVPSSESP